MAIQYDDSGFDSLQMISFFTSIIQDDDYEDLHSEILFRMIKNRAFLISYMHLRRTLRLWGPGNVFTFSGKSGDYGKIESILKENFRHSKGSSIAALFSRLRRERRQADYNYPRRVRRRLHKNHVRTSLKNAEKIVELAQNL